MKTKRRSLWERSVMVMLSLLLVMSSFATVGLWEEVQAAGNTFYVDANNGDDENNDGSENSPFATIGKAFAEIEEQGTIVLLSNVTLDAGLSLSKGENPPKIVTIQSNENEKYSIIRDNNLTNTMIDINNSGGQVVFKNLIIDGNEVQATNYGVYNAYTDTTFEDVEIKNHYNAGGAGRAVIMSYGSGSMVTIKGETKIHNNTISNKNKDNPPSILGAGSRGVLIIEDGLITNNQVIGDSNGVVVGIGLYQSPTFRMTGGTIKDNQLLGNEFMDGETVGNVAVYMRGSSAQARFEFSGTPVVYDNKNTAGGQRNVFLKNTAARDNAFLSLVDSMQSGAKVGVYANIMPTNDNPIVDLAIGYGGYEVTQTDATYFESDLETSAVVGFDDHNGKKKVVLIPVPRLESAWMDKTEVDGKDITFIFSDPIKLDNLNGFKIEVGGTVVTPASFEVDPEDGRKLKVTLAEEPNANIVVTYSEDDGNLKGTNGIAVEDFEFTYDISYATGLDITEPSDDPAKVIESKPELSGTTKVGSTVNVVVKDKDGNVVSGAGGNATVDGSGNWSFESFIDLGTGIYTFEVTATSPDGKIAVTKIKEIDVELIVPELETAILNATEKKITLTFDQEVELGSQESEGFTITVDGEEVTLQDVDFEVDSNDSKNLIITLPNDTDVTGKTVNVSYNGNGNLKGTNGAPVQSFNKNAEDLFAAALKMTSPDTETVTTARPEIAGTVEAGSDVTVTIKDQDGNPVTVAGGSATVIDDTWTFTPTFDLENGNYTIEVTATKDGKTATKTKDIAVDVETPTVTLTAPTEDTVTTGKPTFSGTATPGATITVKLAEGNELTTTADASGDWSVTPTDDLTDGTYNVEITAEKDGKTSTPVTKDITVSTSGGETPVNKTALQAKVDEINGGNLDANDYTPTSWQALQNALTQSQTVLDDNDATQQEVDDALATLTSAYVGLEPLPTVDKSLLQARVDIVQALIESDYTTESWADLEPELSHAIAVLHDLNATQQDIDAAYEALRLKHNALEFADSEMEVDKAALQAKVIEIDDENLDEHIYTSESWQALQVALTEAESVLADVDATQADVNEALTQLIAARETLTLAPVVDKTLLLAKVAEIDGENLTEANYTPSSWQAFQNAWSYAQTILNDATATQTAVDAALLSLTSARNGLIGVSQSNSLLISLVPSFGSLSPSFSSEQYHYSLSVGYGVSQLPLSAVASDPFATIEMSVNGQSVTTNTLPLVVGRNDVVITVTDSQGHSKHYTITVIRDSGSDGGSSGGGGGGGTPSTPSEPSAPTKETIVVDLEIVGDNPLEKTSVTIERTKETDGRVNDSVALTPNQAQEAVDKAKQIGNDTARIVIPDVKDEVDEVNVGVSRQSIETLRDNGISLEILTDNAKIELPVSSMDGIDDDVYFRLVPIKKESERQEIEERARVEQVVRVIAGNEDVNVVARPMTIETNLSSRPVILTLPLKGVALPADEAERQAYLKRLGVFIEHSDGEKEVVFGDVVTMENGELGIRFTIDKFSTFTIIELPDGEQHEAYIQGFPNGLFQPNEAVTRAQVAAMVARNLGYTGSERTSLAPFHDVSPSHYASGVIRFVKEAGLMTGDPNGSFRPNDTITRAEMATIVAKYKQLALETTSQPSFNDTQGHWAEAFIEASRHAGLVTGYENGEYRPNRSLTRAEAVAMLNRLFERGPLYGVTTPSFPDVRSNHWAFNDIEEAATTHQFYLDEERREYVVQ